MLKWLLLFVSLATSAIAKSSLAPAIIIPNNSPALTPQVFMCTGQSWAGQFFADLTIVTAGLNSQTQTLLTLSLTQANFPSGVIPFSTLGIPGNGVLGAVRGYTPNMVYPTTGSAADTSNALDSCRIAVLAQQLMRLAANKLPLIPIIEFNPSCPSSSWATSPTNNGCYGLGPNGTNYLGVPAVNGNQQPWLSQTLVINGIAAALPSAQLRLNAPVYNAVFWQQGGSFDASSPTPTITEFTSMVDTYDALNLPGTSITPLKFYIPIRGMLSTDTVESNQSIGIRQFCRLNSGHGSNSRVYCTYPWYQWPYDGSGIHLAEPGLKREGDFTGLVKYIVEDEGVAFTPLWLSLTNPFVVSGSTVTIPIDRPSGAEFASGVLGWSSDPNNGVKVWPQNGFHVYRSGVEQPLCNGTPTIVGMTVVVDICEPVLSGDEVSYAHYGLGDGAGVAAGVGGNLMMTGPQSKVWAWTNDAWMWPFAELMP